MRSAPSHRSIPPVSPAPALPASRTDSRPRSGRSACCLLAWRRLQVSLTTLFKSRRRASAPDVTTVIVSVDIDLVGVAGRRGGSPMRPSVARPRSPARVPCILRAPWQSRAGCAVCMQQVSADAVVAARTFLLAAVARRGVTGAVACGQWAARAVGRGEGAAARRSRRGERPGLAAVGARDGWAVWRVRWPPPASRVDVPAPHR